jgi:hypothetical protein
MMARASVLTASPELTNEHRLYWKGTMSKYNGGLRRENRCAPQLVEPTKPQHLTLHDIREGLSPSRLLK